MRINFFVVFRTIRKPPEEIFQISQYLHEKESRQFENHHVVIPNRDDKTPIEKVAKIAGVNKNTVSKINKVFKSPHEDIKEAVKNEKISIDKAYRQVKLKERKEDIKENFQKK